MNQLNRNLLPYVLAVGLTLATFFVRWGLDFYVDRPLLALFIVPIMISAYVGGLKPGLLATALAALGAAWLFIVHDLWGKAWAIDLLQWSILLTLGILISLLCEAMHRAIRLAEQAQREKNELLARQTEAALYERDERLRFHMENSPLALVEWDRDFRVVRWSSGAERIFGWSEREVLGKHPAEFGLIDEADREVVGERMIAQLSTGQAGRVSSANRNYRKDGRLVHCEWHSSALLDGQGELISILSLAQDVTERKRAEEELRRTTALLQALTEVTPDPVFVKDSQGRMLLANPATLRAIGKPAEAVLGKNETGWLDNPEQAAVIMANDRRIMASGRSEVVEEALSTPEGVRIFQGTKTPLHDETGQVTGIVGISRDITEAKRSERLLHERNERLALLSETAGSLLGGEDPDQTIQALFRKVVRHLGVDAYFNFMVDETGRALRLASCYGIPETTARKLERLEFGQTVCGTVAEQCRAIHITSIQQADDPKVQPVRELGMRAFICHPLLAGERLLGTLAFGSRLKDAYDEDELTFMGIFCRYVALALERMRLERELRDKVAALAEADRCKDEFLAMLAHELRNPLSPVRNAVKIMELACGGTCATAARMLRQREIIDRQVSHMARLADDLLDVSRVTRGKIILKAQPVVLADVLAHALDTAAPMIEARGQSLHFTPPPDGLRVEADWDRLIQIVGNLLSNAAKYTNDGGRIWLEAGLEGRDAVLRVRDSGIGLDPQMLPRVFDLFAQAEAGLARSQGGLGIGLTMVRSLVQMHGGTIEARSAGLGLGSEFIVRLPALEDAAAMLVGTDRNGGGPKG